MSSIDDLKREIAKEKAIIDYERNESEDYEERVRLKKELNDLRFKRKYGKTIAKVKPVFNELKNAFGKVSNQVHNMQEEQNRRERQEKAIKKRGFGGGLFG